MRSNIALLIFDEVEVLDFAGPYEVFSVADEQHDHQLFNVFTVGLLPGTVRTRNGLKVVPDYALERCPAPNGLIVPGGFGAHALLKQPTLLEWIRHKTKHAEFTMSAHLCWPKPVCWMVCG
jgi:transcriptional regulator GlxA family with amidase domain|uniref:DJ-1/PfpI family protein n=1 Tax=Cephaloticoccus sp. TaxID=1985742 RepID=UPI004048EBC2